jgi:hypothetical protein
VLIRFNSFDLTALFRWPIKPFKLSLFGIFLMSCKECRFIGSVLHVTFEGGSLVSVWYILFCLIYSNNLHSVPRVFTVIFSGLHVSFFPQRVQLSDVSNHKSINVNPSFSEFPTSRIECLQSNLVYSFTVWFFSVFINYVLCSVGFYRLLRISHLFTVYLVVDL